MKTQLDQSQTYSGGPFNPPPAPDFFQFGRSYDISEYIYRGRGGYTYWFKFFKAKDGTKFLLDADNRVATADEIIDMILNLSDTLDGTDDLNAYDRKVEEFTTAIENALAVKPQITTPHREKERKVKRAGYVYLIRASSGHYKIGRTIDPDNRRRTFGVKLPFEVSYEHLIKATDYVQLEAELHARFAPKRVNGEWFDLTQDDIDYIKSL